MLGLFFNAFKQSEKPCSSPSSLILHTLLLNDLSGTPSASRRERQLLCGYHWWLYKQPQSFDSSALSIKRLFFFGYEQIAMRFASWLTFTSHCPQVPSNKILLWGPKHNRLLWWWHDELFILRWGCESLKVTREVYLMLFHPSHHLSLTCYTAAVVSSVFFSSWGEKAAYSTRHLGEQIPAKLSSSRRHMWR